MCSTGPTRRARCAPTSRSPTSSPSSARSRRSTASARETGGATSSSCSTGSARADHYAPRRVPPAARAARRAARLRGRGRLRPGPVARGAAAHRVPQEVREAEGHGARRGVPEPLPLGLPEAPEALPVRREGPRLQAERDREARRAGGGLHVAGHEAEGLSAGPLRGPRAQPPAALEDGQVALELPGRDLDAVVVPLLALDLDVAVEDVLPERAEHEFGLGRALDRFAERLGELLDAEAPALVRRQVVEVLLHRLG